MNAFLFLAEGFEEIEALATVDILRRADIEVSTVSITSEKNVKGKMGITVMADTIFDEIVDLDGDILILPGGPAVSKLKEHEGLENLLKEYYMEEKWIAAICPAPTVLAKLELLKNRKAICYPGLEDELEEASIQEDVEVVVDEKIVTSKGPGTTFPFAIKIVELLQGKDKAEKIAEEMVYTEKLKS